MAVIKQAMVTGRISAIRILSMILIPKQTAFESLNDVMRSLPHTNSPNEPRLLAWISGTKTVLGTIFGEDSECVKDFKRIRWGVFTPSTEHPHVIEQRDREQLERARAVSMGILRSLHERVSHEVEPMPMVLQVPPEPTKTATLSRRIFIVHGHDTGLRQSVARYIKTLGLDPVILMEQPNKGRTLIEKFEEESDDSSFAVVLATGDDLAASVKVLTSAHPNEQLDTLQLRARQNVIFELGFFVAKLRRERVMLVSDLDVELFSDYAGVVFTSRDEWRSKLWSELDSAGFALDVKDIKAATAIEV